MDEDENGKSWTRGSQELAGHSIAHKTQSLFTSIKERWSRKKRRDDDGQSTDYAADNSSEQSTPKTLSPRHRQTISVSGAAAAVAAACAMVEEGDCWARVSPEHAKPDQSQLTSEEKKRRRESALRQHSFFQLRVNLRRGKNLVARDKSGTSDPYVKFKVNGRLLYKSKIIYRDLNPMWEELFTLPIEDPFIPLHIKVFDYDWGLQDDFMGSALLDLTTLELGISQDMVLPLEDPNKAGELMGELYITFTLYPKSQEDKEQEEGYGGQESAPRVPRSFNEGHIYPVVLFRVPQNYFQRNSKISDANRRLKSQIWSSVVTIVLIEAKNLVPTDTEGSCDPYAKFRLGNEKYKSRVAYKTLNPSWLEQFDLHLYDDQAQELEISVWDKAKPKDDFIGKTEQSGPNCLRMPWVCRVHAFMLYRAQKAVIDLTLLEREKTHRIKQPLEECAGSFYILLTISGTTASETISDLTTYEENPKENKALSERYSILRTFHNLRDVGHLTVRVYKAKGLASADLGGKSDPFCVLELINARLQTQTEYKTLCPSWQKIFTFNVKDITSVLEVTVYDEDRDHKVEFLGKVAIPLLKIKNDEKRWYALKDKKLYGRAKGNYPQILLELSVVWNPVRACIRTLNPKEEKYMQTEIKFKRQVFVRNVMRLKVMILWFIDISKFIQSCFEWESTLQSSIAFVTFVLLCYYFEPFMVPLGLLFIFLKCYVVHTVAGTWSSSEDEDEPLGDEEEDEDDKDKEEKKSLKERLQAIQEVTQTVQNSIGHIATLGESIKNTFNFTVPFLSYLAVGLLVCGVLVLYWIPVRYLILIWGVNKFARKLIRPHTIPNNEVLDLLSRVPDNEDLISFRELRVYPTAENERRPGTRKKKIL